MAKTKPSAELNERERRFVDAYMADPNATTAAQKAGYSAKTAASIGSRLLKKVKIRKALAGRVKDDPKVADRDARQRFWTAVMLGVGKFKKIGMKERLKASELLGKSQGDFIEKHEHSGRDGNPMQVKVTFGGRYRPQDGA